MSRIWHSGKYLFSRFSLSTMVDILLDHDASLLLHDEDRYCMVQDMRKEDKTLLVELSVG